MIEFRPEKISPTEETNFRRWLKSGDFKLMEKIIQSKAQVHELDALKKALQSAEFPAYTAEANDSLGKAKRYHTFLDVLKEVMEQTEAFELLKPLNPG
jgi:hypothetical protein